MEMRGHTFYTPEDFTQEEIDNNNRLARMVIDGGLYICKRCGAAEGELVEYVDCESYDRAKRFERIRAEKTAR